MNMHHNSKAQQFEDFTHSHRSELYQFNNGDKAFHEMNGKGAHRIVVIREGKPIYGEITIYMHPALWFEPDNKDQKMCPKYVAFSAYYFGDANWGERPLLVSME